MKKFYVLYHAPIDAWTQTSGATQEEMEEGMKAWMDWAARCGDKLVDMGTPLGNAVKLSPGGKQGPSDKFVAGFSVLQAATLEEATELLKDHPHLAWNEACEIEVHESLPTPGA